MYTKIFLTETKDNMFWYKTPYLLGQSEKWDFVMNNGGLITIGNQTPEDPIKLNFKNKGLYRLTLNLISHMASNLADIIFSIECAGKKNKIYTIGNHMGTLNVEPGYNSEKFSCNFSSLLYANENEISSISVIGHNCWNMSAKTGLYGHTEEIWSSISLEFIPDPVVEESNEPITITQDAQLTLNRRYIVNTKKKGLITLKIKEEDCKLGSWFEVKNLGEGDFRIITGDKIQFVMYNKKTKEKNGYLQSRDLGDFIRLECMQISPKIIFSDTVRIGNYIMV